MYEQNLAAETNDQAHATRSLVCAVQAFEMWWTAQELINSIEPVTENDIQAQRALAFTGTPGPITAKYVYAAKVNLQAHRMKSKALRLCPSLFEPDAQI